MVEAFLECPEQVLTGFDRHGDDPVGIEPHGGEAGGIKQAVPVTQMCWQDPENRSRPGSEQAGGEREAEAERGRNIAPGGRQDFMQGTERQPATGQAPVDVAGTEGQGGGRGGQNRFAVGDMPAQRLDPAFAPCFGRRSLLHIALLPFDTRGHSSPAAQKGR